MFRSICVVTLLLAGCQKNALEAVDASSAPQRTQAPIDAGVRRPPGALLRDVLLEAFPPASIDVPDDSTLLFRLVDHEIRLSLADLEERCRTEAGCTAGINALVENVRGVVTADGGQRVDATQVLPALRAESWVAEANLTMKDKAPEDFAKNQLVTRSFGGGLAVVYVVRQPLGVRLLQMRDAVSLKRDAKGLDVLAMKNLKDSRSTLPAFDKLENREVWSNRDADGLVSTALLMPAWWADFAKTHPGLLVTAPARGRVFAAAGGQREALDELTTAATTLEKELLMPTVFVWSPKGFTPAP
jgi:hypothetical protein